jgi:hypothetical protein
MMINVQEGQAKAARARKVEERPFRAEKINSK